MGAKLEEKVLRSIASYRQRAGRFLLSFAQRRGGRVDASIFEACQASRRSRRRAVCGAARKPSAIWILLVTGPGARGSAGEIRRASASAGGARQRVRTKPASSSGWRACRWICARCPTESYGAALQYFTGSKEHNVALRQRALKMGLTLNEYALARVDNERARG